MKPATAKGTGRFSIKAKAILRITGKELLRSQILWSAVFVQALLSLLFMPLADVGFDESERMYDTLSYFIMTLEALLVACLVGSFLSARDFSKSGLAEVFCREGFGPWSLLGLRLAAFGMGLVVFVLGLGAVHGTGLAFFAPSRFDGTVLLSMVIATSLLALLALLLSSFLSLLVRPAFAGLAALFLMAMGDLAEALSGISSLTSQDERHLGTVSVALDTLVGLWRPQDLILEQRGGEWIVPELSRALSVLGWSVGFMILLAMGVGLLSRRSVKQRVG